MVSNINFTTQIDNQNQANTVESSISDAVKTVFESQFGDRMRDLVNYGSPQNGSQNVVERFSKQDGLLVLQRSDTANVIMQIMYANWLSLGSKRGLNYLEFVLRMVWGNTYTITRLFHSISYIDKYPLFLTETESSDTFLTSRIMVSISDTVNLSELSELSPMLQRLVPANIISSITSEALKTSDNFNVGVAFAGKAFNIVDLS